MPSAKRVSWAKFRALVVAIAALSILSVLVYLLTGGTLLREQTALYLYIPDATGLGSETIVRVNGIDVGKVGAVAFSGSNEPNQIIRVMLRLDRKALQDIPQDSYAEINNDNPVGDKSVDITRGRSTSPIPPNATLPFHPQPELLKTIDMEEFEKRLRLIDATLSDIEQGKTLLGQALQNDDLYNRFRAWVAGMEHVVRNAAGSTSIVGRLAYTDELYQHLNAPAVELDRTLARIQAGQGTFGQLLREDGQYLNLRQQLADLQKSIESVRSDAFLQSDESYNSWNQALGQIVRQVDDFNSNPLLVTSELYDNLAGAVKQIGDTVGEFRRDPQKFLRIKVF